MAGFVQMIEFESQRIDEIKQLSDSMREGQNDGPTVRRITVAADRDRPGHYVSIVEFDSYDSAMENSARPETAEFAEAMGKLCDGPPTFHNLDVMDTWQP